MNVNSSASILPAGTQDHGAEAKSATTPPATQCGGKRFVVRRRVVRLGGTLFALAAILSLTGCLSFLKPARPTARYFVLTPLPAKQNGIQGAAPGVGLGAVKLPAYLFDTSFAVRKGANEIEYLPTVIWGERLDNGLQRVLAANVATLLPTDQVRLSAWRMEEVGVEIYVTIEQLEVDQEGRGTLAARWSLVSPGGGKLLKAGETQLTREGPGPETNPSGAVATLSALVGELSQELVVAMKSTKAGQ